MRALIFYITGAEPEEALRESLDYMLKKTSGVGGAIAVDAQGRFGVAFTAERMSWAAVQDGQLVHGIYPGERLKQQP
jgi:isoaspartyl peptidase/L-asparaginase-like protein (Ntn-hydrolase superfamily)